MKNVRRGLLYVLMIIGFSVMALNFFVEKIARQALRATAAYAKQKGVILLNPRFEAVYFSSFNTLTMKNFISEMTPAKATRVTDPKFSVYFRQADVHLSPSGVSVKILNPVAEVSEKVRSEAAVVKAGAEFRGSVVSFSFPVNWFKFSTYPDALKQVELEVKKIAQVGNTAYPVEVAGQMKFSVAGVLVTTMIQTKKIGDLTYFVMEKSAVLKISELVDEKLTDSEIEFVAWHALQAAKLLRIKNYAKRTAHTANLIDPSVPEDAYRHVLWSYTLTREFGEDFAKEATDAHEVGNRDEDNTQADHVMDDHNNAVGRRYALNGVPESKIISLVRIDQDVIRDVHQVGRLKKSLLDRSALRG